MRIAVLAGMLAAAVGCGAGASAPASPQAPMAATELTITSWPQGRQKPAAGTWTLRCSPAGGTLPRAAAACAKLGAMTNPFAPIPKDAMCTEQYGGPHVAVIKGTYRGRAIWVQLQRRNGCEIARFKKLSFLVPGSSGTGGEA